MRSNQNRENPINYTFVNSGNSFTFRVDKMTRHPYMERGATMAQVHAILTLEGIQAGEQVRLLDERGRTLDRAALRVIARTGKVPSTDTIRGQGILNGLPK